MSTIKYMESEGARLKRAREARKLTLRSVAFLTDYSIGTISGVENGHDAPSPRLRSQLIAIYRISESWLKTGVGEMFDKLKEASDSARVKTPEFQRSLSASAHATILQLRRAAKAFKERAECDVMAAKVRAEALEAQALAIEEMADALEEKSKGVLTGLDKA